MEGCWCCFTKRSEKSRPTLPFPARRIVRDHPSVSILFIIPGHKSPAGRPHRCGNVLCWSFQAAPGYEFFLLNELHQRLIAEQALANVPKQLILAIKHKVLHMKGADPVAVILKSLANDSFLSLRRHLIRMDQVHTV